ncbi:MAG: hypothetical protein V3U98_09610 [Acidobacteriota bacterium]
MAMKCLECGEKMISRKATVDTPYVYNLSGLRRVFLCGITVNLCPKCGVKMPLIPRIEELHNVIMLDLVREARSLKGDEIRFLRKHAGFPAKKFAVLLGISPEHLSRVENSVDKSLGASTDKLARFLVLSARKEEQARESLLELAEQLVESERGAEAEEPPLFELVRNHWRSAA